MSDNIQDVNITFSERLKEEREKRKITRVQLAKMAGVTPSTISSYESLEENGKKPSLKNAAKIAECLGVSLDSLCGTEKYVELTDEEMNTIFLSHLIECINYFDLQVSVNTGGACVMADEYSSPHIYNFLLEYSKIQSFIKDDNYPDYLKEGLLDAITQKYNKCDFSDGLPY